MAELAPLHSSRALNRTYEEKLVGRIAFKAVRSLFFPAPLRIAYTLWKSIPYLFRGVRCLLRGKLRVELLDGLSIGISMVRRDFATAGSVDVYKRQILEVKGLSIAFQQYDAGTRQRRLPVIRDLSLTVGAGQVVAVVGSSGSGKSLLAHGILGILPYNAAMEGEIRYDGELLTPERVEALRGREIVLVPQGVTLSLIHI